MNLRGSMSTRSSSPASGKRSRQKSVSAISVPTASTTSASLIICQPASTHRLDPAFSGACGGSRPLPATLVNSGAAKRVLSCSSGSAACKAPPPAMIIGRLAEASLQAACSRAWRSGRPRPGRRSTSWLQSRATGAARTSSGTEMCTGRGRSLSNTAQARAISSGRSSAAKATAENAVIGAVMARWSWVSCRQPQPLPRLAVWLMLEITSMGIESA
ncbi:hypothetical protein D3C79_598950 [compost metagenome]